MVLANKFYSLAKQKLPIVTREACDLFSIDKCDTEIVWVDKSAEEAAEVRETILCYDNTLRKIKFSPQDFTVQYPHLKRRLSKNMKNYTLEQGVMSYLSHEVPHNVHDAKADYEISKQTMELEIAMLVPNRELKIISCAGYGVKEGIAEYAGNVILERLGYDELKESDDKFRNQIIKRAITDNACIQLKDIPETISESPHSSSAFNIFVSELLKRQFEKKTLDFNETTKTWRPLQFPYEAAETLLESSFLFLKSRYLGKI